MTFAGYSLSFFSTAHEYARDKIRALCHTFVIVTTIKSLNPCGAWKAKAAIIYNLRKKIALDSGKPACRKTILGIGYKFASRE